MCWCLWCLGTWLALGVELRSVSAQRALAKKKRGRGAKAHLIERVRDDKPFPRSRYFGRHIGLAIGVVAVAVGISALALGIVYAIGYAVLSLV